MSSTSRWALPYPQGTDVPDVPLWMGNLALKLDSVAMDSQGLLSARPAATTSGRYYFATDDTTGGPNGTLYRADGTAWRQVNRQDDSQGLLAARPAAATSGRYYFATNDTTGGPNGTLYRDDGAAWRQISMSVPTVTSLPGSPVNGQEIYYVADATNGVVWHLRYRSASPSAYKWEFVGGTGFFGQLAGQVTTTTTGWITLAPVLQFTLPLAGDYQVRHGAGCIGNTIASYSFMAAMLNGSGLIGVLQVFGNAGSSAAPGMMEWTIGGATAGSIIEQRYMVGGGTGSYNNRFMTVIPMRVG